MGKNCTEFTDRFQRSELCDRRKYMELTETIDFVVLWVDGNDPQWRKKRTLYEQNRSGNGTDENRYRDWDLMRYWFRGVERFAPWVNRVFFVTDGQVPSWLNGEHPKLRLVMHEDYIPEQYLPTFNSNVIELWIHRIPGLSEKFVLFNDDMFLTAPVRPGDFFDGNLPRDTALLDIATSPGPEDCLPHMLINNFALVNRHFRKKDVMRQNVRKFFSLKYRGDLLRNILLTPFQYFSCFRDSHLPSSYLKSTFEKVWAFEGELLEECSRHRFRSKVDLTHWLMKCWQICEGNFSVRGTGWGRHFELWEDSMREICRSIEKQRYRAICLNDSKEDIDFEQVQRRLADSFEYVLGERSEYEKQE